MVKTRKSPVVITMVLFFVAPKLQGQQFAMQIQQWNGHAGP
jgi:hypothetical protein